MFELDYRLKNDTDIIGEWPLSVLLLHRDSNFPWCILVPKRANMSEIYELSEGDQQSLLEESRMLAHALMGVFRPDKLNVAALGNVVKQLHIHHIARFVGDSAWPGPVWGAVAMKEYKGNAFADRIEVLRKALSGTGLHW
ncbi:MAG: HIT family protein [Gammaproteobacteria bacterium]|nr:MAG: HIT family protein [Gammaproteobacteria bacterium]RLA52077.1 MAG: HIT family protein [Gammaproteobacteria bacterium]